ncbi:MAG: ANTAR domain-containing protein [Pseudomonadales bacterium]|nr:ANTAR domain-containing protein [Pseudomonadales bacterium]MCP5344253.1 ANTAR domain-containing protein [Pseudomonadales bacterium]
MLVDDHADRAQRVEEHLQAAGFEVLSIISSATGLLYQIEQQKPDVVIIDLQSPDRDVLESLAIVNHHNPIAMVMFANEEDPNYIREAFAAGISTYLTEGLNPARVRPVIEVAMEQFRAFQSLRKELHSARTELEDRTLIEKAKGLLMAQKRISENEAHQLLTKMAMDSNQRLPNVARTVVATLSALEVRK